MFVARVTLGSALSIALVVTGLWCWQFAPPVAGRADVTNPVVIAWAVRAAGIAAIAAGQFCALAFVVGACFSRTAFDRALQWGACLAFTAAGAGACAFAVAGR